MTRLYLISILILILPQCRADYDYVYDYDSETSDSSSDAKCDSSSSECEYDNNDAKPCQKRTVDESSNAPGSPEESLANPVHSDGRRSEPTDTADDEKEDMEEEEIRLLNKMKQEKERKARQKEREKYHKINITNDYDYEIQDILDEAEDFLRKANGAKITELVEKYLKLTQRYRESPRAWYGLAKSFEKKNIKLKSGELTRQTADAYGRVLHLPNVPEIIFINTLEQIVRIAPKGTKVAAQKRLLKEYPDRTDLHLRLVTTYMGQKLGHTARPLLESILEKDPNNLEARAYYGILVKSIDRDLEKAVEYMSPTIHAAHAFKKAKDVYFNLGDALNKLGRREKAMPVFEEGARQGHFLSAIQRSKHNVNHLTGRPWWTMEQTGHTKELQELERNWEVIREEGVKIMKEHSVRPDDQRLAETGAWDKLILFTRGEMVKENCAITPRTCELILKFEAAATNKRGQVKFSILEAGSKLLPHCGPTNCRVRAHLGLVVPPEPKIRVANETKSWIEGKFIIFDDSFDHEVWHDGTESRLVLIVDFWHPELTAAERKNLPAVGPSVDKAAGKKDSPEARAWKAGKQTLT